MISVCIPCCNDQFELDICIDSILRTKTLDVEIIVCDDGSKEPIRNKNAKIIRHKNQIGVGSSIDTAILNSKYDNIIISGSDIVFLDDSWDIRCVKNLETHPKSIFSTPIRGYNPKDNVLSEKSRIGCNFILKAGLKDIPIVRRGSFPENWKMLYRSKWMRGLGSVEIPNILGARYFIKKDWYNYLLGFNGHRYWGSLDSYLGMKSWLCGGSCRVDASTTHGHIYSRNNTVKPMDWFIYNKILVTKTLFPKEEVELLDWIKDDPNYINGLNIINSYPLNEKVSQIRDFLSGKIIHSYDWYDNKIKALIKKY